MSGGSVWVWWVVLTAVVAVVLKTVLKKVNPLLYEVVKLGEKRHCLPPGDLGWPIFGNMWSFLRAFKSTNPDSFMKSFISRFGKTGMYKAFMFGHPSIIVTTPDAVKRVLSDDDNFKPGWPASTVTLIGKKSFAAINHDEHKRLRKLTAAPINGHEALSNYLTYIEELSISALEKWSKMDAEIEFLTEARKLTFKIVMYIFLSTESEKVMEAMEREYTRMNYGIRAMKINIPGFAYYKALKSRKRLDAVLQSALDERRERRRRNGGGGNNNKKKKDMMDSLLDVVDEKGRHLMDDEIIDLLIMYLNAGHESSGHTIMWATILLQNNPDIFKKAKEEQVQIVKQRDPTQKGLSMKEVREMKYLSKVIDETLRWVSFSLFVFREATSDVNVNGYLIPKGWKVLTWFRTIHHDPDTYPDPYEFNPSRWDNHTAKAGTFVPFGLGSRLCPGNDLALLEIAVFLHYFLLGYRLERKNPDCQCLYLPHRRPKDNCVGRVVKL